MNDDEEKEAEQLSRSDMSALGQVVREVVEARPDGRDHSLQALTSLETLCTEPDTRHDTSDEDRKVCSSSPEAGTREDGKVDTEHGTHVGIEHGRYTHEEVPDQDGEDRQAWVEAFAHGTRSDLVHRDGKGLGHPKSEK